MTRNLWFFYQWHMLNYSNSQKDLEDNIAQFIRNNGHLNCRSINMYLRDFIEEQTSVWINYSTQFHVFNCESSSSTNYIEICVSVCLSVCISVCLSANLKLISVVQPQATPKHPHFAVTKNLLRSACSKTIMSDMTKENLKQQIVIRVLDDVDIDIGHLMHCNGERDYWYWFVPGCWQFQQNVETRAREVIRTWLENKLVVWGRRERAAPDSLFVWL